MVENLIIQYKTKKDVSKFRGVVMLQVGRAGIACSVINHDYESPSQVAHALDKALPVLLRIAAEDCLKNLEGKVSENKELEIIEIFINAVQKLDKMAEAKNIISFI